MTDHTIHYNIIDVLTEHKQLNQSDLNKAIFLSNLFTYLYRMKINILGGGKQYTGRCTL